ncbi:glycerophosphodiester phosphodiesterase [uncultured Shewanella sp.]|uniref:glycerophosphodiester phosphodiesterase n=1 Tax=uncultured Shewanella sp. TaxID=173975 RepID=UPI00261158A1|nr:glycerophosphodiester phosphodiesterase [uncultured Shewanella sp.]
MSILKYIKPVTLLFSLSFVFISTIVMAEDHKTFNEVEREVLAHRGASGDYPQSTSLAFQMALEQGADILEMDVHLSLDGHVIVNHDKDFSQTTDSDNKVADLTLADIKALDAGYRFSKDGGETYPFRATGLEVLTLEEVIAYFPVKKLSIEMKVNDEQLADSLWAILDRNGLHHQATVASQYTKALNHFRAVSNNSIQTSASITELTGLSLAWAAGLGGIYPAKFTLAQIPYAMISRPFLSFLQNKGITSHVWTVNEIDKIERAFDLGAKGVIGDYPDRIVQVLAARGER